MSRRRNRPTGPDQTHDRGPGYPARHPAGLTALTAAGESLHAPVCAGVEEARPRAKPRHSPRHLCGRSCDLCRRGSAEKALHHLREIIGKLKLTVNEEKTRICKVPDGEFDFLGYSGLQAHTERSSSWTDQSCGQAA